MILYLNGEVGPEMSAALAQYLNTLKEGEHLDIYFMSEGGYLNDTFVILDMINRNSSKITLRAFGEIASAGFIIFFAATCPKFIMNYTIGMAHYASMFVPSNQAGEVPDDGYATFAYTQLLTSKDEFIAFYKSTGMNKKEMDLLKKGKDVMFSTERLNELLQWQQKQKRTA